MSAVPREGDRDDVPADQDDQGGSFRPTEPSEQPPEESEEHQGDDAGSGGS